MYIRYLILMVVLLLLGCTKSAPDVHQQFVIQYNRESQQLTQVGRKFGAAIGPWGLGEAADVPAAEKALVEMEELVRTMRTDFNRRDVPDGDAAQEFHKEINEYLVWQLDGTKSCGDLLEFIVAHSPGDESAIEFVFSKLDQLNQQEMALKAKSDAIAKKLGVIVDRSR